jgi:hypothetical protein
VKRDDTANPYFEKGACFIEIVYHKTSGQVGLYVGQHDIYEVPLPPWPSDELPDFLVETLPPMAADITVTGHDDGFFVSAEQVSLNDLYKFIKAATQHHGWSELSEEGEMVHNEIGFGMRMISFDTDAGHWTMTIFDASQPNSTLSPGDTQPPSVTGIPESGHDDIGITEFGYRVTTERYSEQDAMMGVLDEYGQYAEIADWNDIKTIYGDHIESFLEQAGVEVDDDVWVQYNGQSFDGKRHYFLARISAAREGFKLYDNIGNVAWLGSWYGIEIPVLVKVPSDQL